MPAEDVRTIARRQGVDERQVRRWCRAGKVDCWTTVGGQWRIEVDAKGRPIVLKPSGHRGRPRQMDVVPDRP